MDEIKIPTFSQVYPIQILINKVRSGEIRLSELDCSDATRSALEDIAQVSHQKKIRNEIVDGTPKSRVDMITELEDLLIELRELKDSNTAMDTRERIATVNTTAKLLSELISLTSEAKRFKKIGEYQEFIFSILTEEQKNKVIELYHSDI